MKYPYQHYGLDTLALHAGFRCDQGEGSAQVPIHQTSAYVFGSTQQAQELYPQLDNCRELCLVDKNSSRMVSRAVLLPSYLAKGLEFDRVVVLLEGMEEDRHLQYVCCTRALHELTLVELDHGPAGR